MERVDAPPLIDGHCDTLQKLPRAGTDAVQAFLTGLAGAHLDLPRALAGGMRAGLFSIYPPAGAYEAADEAARWQCARAHALRLMGLLQRIETAAAGRLRRITDTTALEACLSGEALGAILHLEGLEPIGRDLAALETHYGAGLRSVGLAWTRDNAFASAAKAGTELPEPGLSDLGLEAVRECNRLGIVVDVSHLSPASFRDVAGLSSAPLVATHSNAYALSPHYRNLRDWQLDAIRDSGGLVGILFCVAFLRPDPDTPGDPGLGAVIRHLEYVAARIGIEHVAFGSDFDGAVIPADIADAAGYPRLMTALRQRGLDAAILAQIAHGNWLRVLRKTWRPAAPPG